MASPAVPGRGGGGGGDGSQPPAQSASGDVRLIHGGKYQVIGKIGKGSYAKVYLGVSTETGEKFAIKSISRKQIEESEHVDKNKANLRREIETLGQLHHPNIVRLYEVIRTRNHMYLVMEYCGGHSLAEFLRARGQRQDPPVRQARLPEPLAKHFLIHLAQGLRYLHERRLVHRDLKPANLLLTESPRPEEAVLKIADFGFVRPLGMEEMEATTCGSPLYMAPEVLKNAPYNARADLWSVGTILYEMIAGRPPYTALTTIELLRKIQTARRLKYPADVEVSPELDNLLQRLLEPDPKQRISFGDFFAHPFLQDTMVAAAAASRGRGAGEDRHGKLEEASAALAADPDPPNPSQQQQPRPDLPQHPLPDSSSQQPDSHQGSLLAPEGSVHQLQTPSLQNLTGEPLFNRHDNSLARHPTGAGTANGSPPPFQVITAAVEASPRGPGSAPLLPGQPRIASAGSELFGAEADLARTLHLLLPGSVLDLASFPRLRDLMHTLKVLTKRAELVGRCGEFQLRNNGLVLTGFLSEGKLVASLLRLPKDQVDDRSILNNPAATIANHPAPEPLPVAGTSHGSSGAATGFSSRPGLADDEDEGDSAFATIRQPPAGVQGRGPTVSGPSGLASRWRPPSQQQSPPSGNSNSMPDSAIALDSRRLSILFEALQLYLRCQCSLLRALVAVDQTLYLAREQLHRRTEIPDASPECLSQASLDSMRAACRCRNAAAAVSPGLGSPAAAGDEASAFPPVHCKCWERRSAYARQEFTRVMAMLAEVPIAQLRLAVEELVDLGGWLRESFLSYHARSRIIKQYMLGIEVLRETQQSDDSGSLAASLPSSPSSMAGILGPVQFAPHIRVVSADDPAPVATEPGQPDPAQPASPGQLVLRCRRSETLIYEYGLVQAREAAVKELMPDDADAGLALRKYKRSYRLLQELLHSAVLPQNPHGGAAAEELKGQGEAPGMAGLPGVSPRDQAILESFMKEIRNRVSQLQKHKAALAAEARSDRPKEKVRPTSALTSELAAVRR